MRGRREFLRASAGFAALLAACATSGVARDDTIDLDPHLVPGAVSGRGAAALLPFNATFVGHLRRIGGDSTMVGIAGIDYAPEPGVPQTSICPALAGVVVGHQDSHDVSGMTVTIAHGLGWKTVYGHLAARFVGYGSGRVARGDVLAIMGASGTGATRGGTQGPLYHMHLTVYGPAYTPLYRQLIVQPWPQSRPGFQHVVDGEDFSLAGRGMPLPYRRPEDDAIDQRFLARHDEAVLFCDDLLDRLGDKDAETASQRSRWERETRFAYHVDERVWHLWQRLHGARHPFDPPTSARHRATLRDFITTVPRLTAPVVEAPRAGEYRAVRATPLKVYESLREFGAR